MKIYVVAVLLMVACRVSAQFPAGFNYNPFLYFPYSALQPLVQETAEVAAARASHMLAHAARGRRSVVDTPEVWAAKVEHYRAHQNAAAANGVVSSLPPLYYYNHAVPQPVQDTTEVAAAKAEFFRAFNAAATRGGSQVIAHAARGKRSIPDTPEVYAAKVEHYRAYTAAATANGRVSYLPAQYPNMPWALPQQVSDTPEVAAAKAEFFRAFNSATARG